MSVLKLDAQNLESAEIQTDDSSDFRQLLASENRTGSVFQNPDAFQSYKAIKKLNYSISRFQALSKIRTRRKPQSSCPKSELVRIAKTHCIQCRAENRMSGLENRT